MLYIDNANDLEFAASTLRKPYNPSVLYNIKGGSHNVPLYRRVHMRARNHSAVRATWEKTRPTTLSDAQTNKTHIRASSRRAARQEKAAAVLTEEPTFTVDSRLQESIEEDQSDWSEALATERQSLTAGGRRRKHATALECAHRKSEIDDHEGHGTVDIIGVIRTNASITNFYEGPQRHCATPLPQLLAARCGRDVEEVYMYGRYIPWQHGVEGPRKSAMEGIALALGSAVWQGCGKSLAQ
ncbi:hypothetical protein Bbelb_123950 [Branchiostoma belcheri]|nr:hypothetical protein Bbelb_123950 [Branchiostoma belcheri]